MSLDVYLTRPQEGKACEHCSGTGVVGTQITCFDANVTHNMATMASEAGIYDALWRPEEIRITKAFELIGPLTNGLELLKSDPERFKAFNPKNGWGSYDLFVPWVAKYLRACEEYPDADVIVSR